jgi:hypothetical protein
MPDRLDRDVGAALLSDWSCAKQRQNTLGAASRAGQVACPTASRRQLRIGEHPHGIKSFSIDLKGSNKWIEMDAS